MSATKQLFEQMREELTHEQAFYYEDLDIMYHDWLRSQEFEKIQAELRPIGANPLKVEEFSDLPF